MKCKRKLLTLLRMRAEKQEEMQEKMGDGKTGEKYYKGVCLQNSVV